jgi:anaerobic selenocysteine-containing dehydrogenase
MNRTDIERLGLHVDERVVVRSAGGEMAGISVRAYVTRAGNALMYYPEANVLVPTTADPLSKTPAFKCVPITVEPHRLMEANSSLRDGETSGRKPLSVLSG